MGKIMFSLSLLIVIASCSNKVKNDSGENDSVDRKSLLQQATQLHDDGYYDSSLALIYSLQELDTQNFKVKLLEGDVHWALRNFKSSMGAYTTCLRWQKKNPMVWARLGKIYLEQSDFETALKYFNQAINLDQSFADGYIGRSMVFLKKGEIEQAYTSLQTAIDFDPNNTNALLRMAEWQMADTNELAIQYLSNALRIDSSRADFYFKRAEANFLFEKYALAQKDYEKAFNLEPDNIEYAINLAYFYFQFELFEISKEQFAACTKINKKDADAWLGLALCQKELGLKSDAIASLMRILELNPNDEDALRELDNLQ